MNDDRKWEIIKHQVRNRDQHCVLLKKLSPGAYYELDKRAGSQMWSFDCAHVFPRSTAPHMKFDPDNIVLLNHYSHMNIDYMKHPILGTLLSKEDHTNWWIWIVGKERYNRLLAKINKYF
jgi:hypothetical protein